MLHGSDSDQAIRLRRLMVEAVTASGYPVQAWARNAASRSTWPKGRRALDADTAGTGSGAHPGPAGSGSRRVSGQVPRGGSVLEYALTTN